jgi:hypothetical protein
MGTLSLVGDVAAEPTEKSSLHETMDKHAGYLFQYETGLVESETRSVKISNLRAQLAASSYLHVIYIFVQVSLWTTVAYC